MTPRFAFCRSPFARSGRVSSLPLLTVLAGWALIAWWGHVRYQPPPLLTSDAPENQFSAERAELILRSVLGDEIQHPAGTPQNDVVRNRILRLVREWGYDPQVQETSNHKYRNKNNELIPLENIVFRKSGSGARPAVMLVAHYDTKPGTPGISDDGVGVSAVLEIARMVAAAPAFERDVIFLLTDGEEYGLLGADKWCQEHPWAGDVGVAINLEARGTTGGSLMFETSLHSRWLVELFARVAERPLTSSLFYEVYRFLPNDTDFTVLKKADIQGYNFAIIGEVRNYHRPTDNLDNLDLGSLQHHGQNAWSLLQELTRIDPAKQTAGRAVYFDLFGSVVVWWPELWSLWISIGVLLWWMFHVGWIRRLHPERSLWATFLRCLALLALVLLCCTLAGYALRLDPRLELRWLDSPLPVELVHWFAAIAALLFGVKFLQRSLDASQVFAVVGLSWCGWALLSSLTVAGASYLFLVPAVAFAAGLRFCRGSAMPWIFVFTALVGGCIWIPLERLFYDALGFASPVLMGVRIVFSMLLLLPLSVAVEKRRELLGWLAIAGFIASVLIAMWLNSQSESGVNVVS